MYTSMMILCYVVVFLVGIVVGILHRCLSTSPQRSPLQRRVVNNRLDDVDQMVLWGEVTNDTFYKGE